MEAKLQRRIQRYGWDAAAGIYGDAWGKQLKPAHDELLNMAALKSGMRVLEVACGTGLVTARAAKMLQPGGALLATDISGEMIEATQQQMDNWGLENIEARRADGEKLNVADDAYDVAFCALGLMYMPEPANAVAEMRRVVKPGGKVAATVWGERRNCAWSGIFPIVDAEVHSEVCPLFFSLGAHDALINTMTNAGLKQVQQVRHSVLLSFPDETTLLSAQIDGGAVALAAKRFDKNTRTRVETSFLASVDEYRHSDGSYEIPGEFVTAAGFV